jgi:hypothetical protein
MTNEEFMWKIVHPRLKHCIDLLDNKNEEYAKDDDRFHNFKKTGIVRNIFPIAALDGMFNKHLISLIDMLDNAAHGILPTQKLIDDKISDVINYLLLFEGLVKEETKDKP